MKTLLVLAALAAASFGQSRCITIKYPCDPAPSHVVFTILDCSGNVLDVVTWRLESQPCTGAARYCVPPAMGNVRIEAAVVAGLQIVKWESFDVGCV
jgi:hypothetical protein